MSLAMQSDPKTNPAAWAYKNMLHGRPVSTVHLVSMFNRHHEESQLKLIKDICTATNQIAVGSSRLTARQRVKYAASRVKVGRRVFYMFSRHMCPADVGANLNLTGKELLHL